MPFEKEVIDLEGCRPIDAQKILYWKDERFADRLLPPPDVPPLNLGLHKARLERRVKPLLTVVDVRETPLESLDLNLHGLDLPLEPNPEQVATLLKTYYDRMRVAPVPAIDEDVRDTREASEPSPSLT